MNLTRPDASLWAALWLLPEGPPAALQALLCLFLRAVAELTRQA